MIVELASSALVHRQRGAADDAGSGTEEPIVFWGVNTVDTQAQNLHTDAESVIVFLRIGSTGCSM